MRWRAVLRAGAVLGAAVVVPLAGTAGCADDGPGQPAPIATTGSTGTTPTDEAPTVSLNLAPGANSLPDIVNQNPSIPLGVKPGSGRGP